MGINFLPNDPLAQEDSPMRKVKPRPERPSTRAGFNYRTTSAEGQYAQGSDEFLYWQCREGALAAMDAWESLDGHLNSWVNNKKRLNLIQNSGEDLNAYYDRKSLAFFHSTHGGKTTYSGASTDVVAHEAGHAFLDKIRPEFWFSTFTEVNAFHEAFGDCMAVLTALSDSKTRKRLIETTPDLWSQNFVETTAEDLSDGIKRILGANHSASMPRHALNFYNWQLPASLPTSGPPGVLVSEIHSFGQVFSGCFYDLIGTLWNSQPSWSDAALLKVSRTAGKLLIEAARTAPEVPRFFKSIGDAMLLIDKQTNGGANQTAITEAFSFHNINLEQMALITPTASLAGNAPTMTRRSFSVPSVTCRDFLSRISAPKTARTVTGLVDIAGEKLAKIVHYRDVDLAGLDNRLANVVVRAAETVLVGSSNKKASIVGNLPEPTNTDTETITFIRSLLDHHLISFKSNQRGVVSDPGQITPTHVIRKSGNKKVLRRVRFSCPGHSKMVNNTKQG